MNVYLISIPAMQQPAYMLMHELTVTIIVRRGVSGHHYEGALAVDRRVKGVDLGDHDSNWNTYALVLLDVEFRSEQFGDPRDYVDCLVVLEVSYRCWAAA